MPFRALLFCSDSDIIPSIATLETLCAAFGISLCQFFAEGTSISQTDERQVLLERLEMLTAEQKKVLLDLMEQMV
ncbi:MAG: hypothetical protein J5449_05650 [Oscillospiraceae bacterium]|nr:hypothetical protein [Oscillospiraceae bacterium]